jgi:hypothetical protein
VSIVERILNRWADINGVANYELVSETHLTPRERLLQHLRIIIHVR